MDINIIEQHISLQNSTNIIELLKPFLDQNNLNHFAYAKHFAKGTGYCLTTHPELALDYHRYKLYETAKFKEEICDQSSTSILWLAANESSQPLFKYVKDYYSISNGITIIEKNEHYTEQFYFAADKDNLAANNHFLNNLDLFKRFNDYFLDSTIQIRKSCDKNPLPNQSKTPPQLFKLYGHLTRREVEIANYLVFGKTARCISQLLNLSVRTVEKHIENIKVRLHVKGKSELIDKLIRNKYF